MQETLNLKIKFREGFRPFAPAVLRERVSDYVELEEASPYMLLVARVKSAVPSENAAEPANFLERLKTPRSGIPAVTHVDHSARVQTVSAEENPRFHQLLSAFERETGCAVLVNTSFNVRGEPLACAPEDAYRCFMRTGIDYLVLGNHLITKTEQTPLPRETESRRTGWLATEYEKLDRSPRALRKFGFTIAGAFLVIALILVLKGRPAGWIWGSLGAVALLFATVAPKALRLFHQAWLSLSIVLGAVITPIVLTFFFFVIVTPIGLLQRLFGKRELELRFKTDEESYWTSRPPREFPADYEKQF